MHTSTRLCAGDFHYWRQAPTGAQAVHFAAFCPNYHYQDRVGVVSLALEQGVLETSYAILALTTAFYDCLRASHEHFFDYPQHFAFVGEATPATGVASRHNSWWATARCRSTRHRCGMPGHGSMSGLMPSG